MTVTTFGDGTARTRGRSALRLRPGADSGRTGHGKAAR